MHEVVALLKQKLYDTYKKNKKKQNVIWYNDQHIKR